MADVQFTIDRSKLRDVANSDVTVRMVGEKTEQVASKANAMGAGYRTGFYHVGHKSPAVGGTQPVYKSDTQRRGKTIVGIVATGNYAAMKDNHLHNTLLKAL